MKLLQPTRATTLWHRVASQLIVLAVLLAMPTGFAMAQTKKTGQNRRSSQKRKQTKPPQNNNGENTTAGTESLQREFVFFTNLDIKDISSKKLQVQIAEETYTLMITKATRICVNGHQASWRELANVKTATIFVDKVGVNEERDINGKTALEIHASGRPGFDPRLPCDPN
jgi:hypothetical protein